MAIFFLILFYFKVALQPFACEVVLLVVGDFDKASSDGYIITESKLGELKRISELHHSFICATPYSISFMHLLCCYFFYFILLHSL